MTDQAAELLHIEVEAFAWSFVCPWSPFSRQLDPLSGIVTLLELINADIISIGCRMMGALVQQRLDLNYLQKLFYILDADNERNDFW